jgi:hypothetical protein
VLEKPKRLNPTFHISNGTSVYTERDRRCHLGTKAPASAFWASPRMLLWTALQVLEFIEHELPKMVVRTISLAEHRYHPLTRHGASVSLVNPSALPVLHSLWVCISHVPVRYNRTTPYCTSLPHAARDWTQPGCGATEEKRFLKIRRAVRDLSFFFFGRAPFHFRSRFLLHPDHVHGVSQARALIQGTRDVEATLTIQ